MSLYILLTFKITGDKVTSSFSNHQIRFWTLTSEEGAHARHYNAHSIGICYEGGLDEKGKPADTRTPAQKASLEDLLYSLVLDYPDAEILGHRDLPWVRKSCPCFDVKEWLKEIDFHL